jgi:hypothetical protein
MVTHQQKRSRFGEELKPAIETIVTVFVTTAFKEKQNKANKIKR